MPTITSSGVGSGLDVNGIVSQLVAADRGPEDQRIALQQAKADAQISAFGSLQGAMSSLQTSVAAIKSVSAFQTRTATSSNTDEFTATATSTAAAGSYSIEVTSLASAHKLSSNAFVGGANAVVGTGTLTIAVGTQSFDVSIDSTNNTLAGIRDAINRSASNNGVQATIVQATDGARLVFSARNTGAANALRVKTSGGDGGLSPLIYNPGTTTNMTETQAAKDAVLKVEGFAVNSPSNRVTGAIDGVTLNLVGAAPGSVQALVVTNDVTTAKDRINKFVTDYNALASILGNLQHYDPNTKVAAPLLGDSMARTIQGALRGGVSSAVSSAAGGFNTLAAIGVTTSSDGTLTVNDTKLTAALSNNFDAVGQLMGGTGGIAAKLSATLDSYLNADAPLSKRTESLQARKKDLNAQTDALNRRMVDAQARYRTQFSALDSLLSSMQTTSAYLTKQLG